MRSFAEAYPELVTEWSEKNTYRPEEVSYGSNKKIIWKGRCGHIWSATVKNRGNGHGCPYCLGNRLLKGFNDLETASPELAKEWSGRNSPLKPDMVTKNTNQIVWWECNECGCQWRARISDRSSGHGCPACTGLRLEPGINDLKALYPELAEEWSEKNGKKPSQIWPRSRESIWWKCRVCGTEYRAVVNSRVKGLKCPVCARRERIRKRPYRSRIEERGFKIKVFAYYAEKAGADILIGSDEIIGIPLEIYFPEQKAAVTFSVPLTSEYRIRRENAKNWLCLKAGIRLIRILTKGANEYDNCICITLEDRRIDLFSECLQAVFGLIGIKADVDIGRDVLEIKNTVITDKGEKNDRGEDNREPERYRMDEAGILP